VISFRSVASAALVALVCTSVAGRAAPALAASDDAVDSTLHVARVARLRGEVEAARGPLAYVALRRVWSEWDRGDPAVVEEALSELAASEREPAPLRAYASLLTAYARRRRGDLDGARARIARLGFVNRWMIIGPFDNDGKSGFSSRYDPEAQQGEPLNLTRDYDGKGHKPVRWRLTPAVSPYGWVDFGSFVRPSEEVCVYATTFVRDARVAAGATRRVTAWTGAAGAVRLFWNGAEAIDDAKYRDLDSDRMAVTLDLTSGWNRLTAKVCSDDRAPMLSLRVADADGRPDEHVETDPDPGHSTPQGGAAPAKVPPGGRRVAIASGVEGPVQSFERMVASDDPAILEAYARYLQYTGADDPSEHRARELTRRAAEKAPTVARLLLAGEVAESRNQRAAWIERAEAKVAGPGASREDHVAVLLARADYARGGVNPRDSIEYYDRVLAVDPDDLQATLARVDLYADAGLRETALGLLGRALARSPRSVALLRAVVAALRDSGRETEADEMAERYSALRFDDPALLRAQVDLAVARRDPGAASRLIDRLVAMNPDSAVAQQTAAQAWMRLGDRARAVAAYKTALDVAPDDTDVMRQLATLYGLGGEHDERLRLLRRVLDLMPQSKEVRDELTHIGPPTPRPDEQYARPPQEFLAARGAPAAGQARRSLVDLQVTSVFPNGLASRFRQVVFQPLTDAAAAQSREYDFSFETDSQTVQLRAARVFRADGRIEEAVASGAGAMADDPSLAIYTTARTYYVRFPRLEPGDVVELQYRVEDIAPWNAFADYFGEVTYMQGSEPIARSEYVLVTPKSRTFYFNEPKVAGLTRTVEERADQRIFHFTALDVAPVVQEPSQPPWPEVLGHVNVSTYKTWDEMGRWYWGLIRDQLVPDDEVRRRAEALTHGLKDDAAKVRAIYEYVVQRTRYVALEFGIHGYKPYRCAQIFARGFGDCKDKATLIVTMLGALGIKATPVVVRTGNKGDIETAPASLAPFDHMIAYVPSLDLYLDGTAEYTGALELPAMDRGAMALRVNADGATLVHLPDPPAAASVTASKLDATLVADGAAQIDWRADISGVDAPEWRVRFHADATRRQRMQQMLAAMLPGAEVTSLDVGSLEDLEKPVSMRVRGRAPQFARTETDGLTVPLGRREHMVRDYAPLVARKLDVRLPSQWTTEDEWTIHLPPGAKVRSVPTSSKAATRFGWYTLDVESDPGLVRVKTVIALTRTRIAPSEYPTFRAFCEQVDRALGQRATVETK
jgi:cellulose synthase operon protein C